MVYGTYKLKDKRSTIQRVMHKLINYINGKRSFQGLKYVVVACNLNEKNVIKVFL